MILPFQNLRWCNTSRDSTNYTRGLDLQQTFVNSFNTVPTVPTLSTMFWIEPCDDRNIATPSAAVLSFTERLYFSERKPPDPHICFDKGRHHRHLQCCFYPFLLVETGIAGFYKFWVWKKKQGPWPKLEKCMKINTCKCIYMQGSYRVLNSRKSLKICPASGKDL